MQTIVKKFSELTNYELYEILKLRSLVFVVEQNCVYLDADSVDLDAYHVYIKDGDEIVAYLRVYDWIIKNLLKSIDKYLLFPYNIITSES